MKGRISHVIGFDDAPFDRAHRGDVPVYGAVYAGTRLEGVLSLKVRRDGVNSTRRIADAVNRCRFAGHMQAILLQGIALAGFNVVDIRTLHRETGLPVLVVMRRPPDFKRIHAALLSRVPGGAAKWRRIQRAGPVEPAGEVWVQRAGLTPEQAVSLIHATAINGGVPEPLRTAHLIAGGVTSGESRGRV
ncbi:MAG: DUF99 family protein [Nitrospirota bacterium]|nr:DUF99 family protein [Nitrospirota bacterium]